VPIHNCQILEAGDPGARGVVRVTAEKFIAAYEKDLLPAPRPDMRPEARAIVSSAEQLAGAYTADVQKANSAYRNKVLTVKGTVKALTKNTVILETGTRDKYQIELVFTPDQMARVPTTIQKDLEFRGVCAGVRGKHIRLENCRYYDPVIVPPMGLLTEKYFPLDPERELFYDVLTPVGAAKQHPIMRVRVQFVEPDLVQVTPLKSGTFPRASLFGAEDAQPKWKVNLLSAKKKIIPESTQVRASEKGLEFRPLPQPPAVPGEFWDPVLRWGARKGATWTTTLPDRRAASYKVVEFARDALGRKTVEILRVVRNPKPADPKNQRREETTIVYVWGIGEVRRVVATRSGTGDGVTVLESRLVEAESTGLEEPKKDRDKAPDPRPKPDCEDEQ
jgi:hypothetical protein